METNDSELTAIALIVELGTYKRLLNVKGELSSDEGRDFARLAELEMILIGNEAGF